MGLKLCRISKRLVPPVGSKDSLGSCAKKCTGDAARAACVSDCLIDLDVPNTCATCVWEALCKPVLMGLRLRVSTVTDIVQQYGLHAKLAKVAAWTRWVFCPGP